MARKCECVLGCRKLSEMYKVQGSPSICLYAHVNVCVASVETVFFFLYACVVFAVY